jgi:hypothetical protein
MSFWRPQWLHVQVFIAAAVHRRCAERAVRFG